MPTKEEMKEFIIYIFVAIAVSIAFYIGINRLWNEGYNCGIMGVEFEKEASYDPFIGCKLSNK